MQNNTVTNLYCINWFSFMGHLKSQCNIWRILFRAERTPTWGGKKDLEELEYLNSPRSFMLVEFKGVDYRHQSKNLRWAIRRPLIRTPQNVNVLAGPFRLSFPSFRLSSGVLVFVLALMFDQVKAREEKQESQGENCDFRQPGCHIQDGEDVDVLRRSAPGSN